MVAPASKSKEYVINNPINLSSLSQACWMIRTENLHVSVYRRFLGTTGVAHAGSDDARQRPEERISRPEAAHAEGGTLTLDLF